MTVVNKSSEPATLFVADEDEQGLLGRLVGTVTPNVVPPGATVEVTFLLPAKGVNGLVDLGEPGTEQRRIGRVDRDVPGGPDHIGPSGQVGWVSP